MLHDNARKRKGVASNTLSRSWQQGVSQQQRTGVLTVIVCIMFGCKFTIMSLHVKSYIMRIFPPHLATNIRAHPCLSVALTSAWAARPSATSAIVKSVNCVLKKLDNSTSKIWIFASKGSIGWKYASFEQVCNSLNANTLPKTRFRNGENRLVTHSYKRKITPLLHVIKGLESML